MGGLAHLRLLTTVTIARPLLALLLLALAACDPALRSFRFVTPDGVGEAFRNGGVPFDVSWQADADPGLDVVLRLEGVIPAAAIYTSPRFPARAGSAAWSLDDGRPGSFRLVADVLDGEALLETIAHGGVVIVQGVEFRDPRLDFTGSSAERDIFVTASTATVMIVDLLAIPDADPGSPVTLAHSSIASDLAPIGRIFTWDAGLAAGAYTVVADVAARDGTIRYRDGALAVDWRPGD